MEMSKPEANSRYQQGNLKSLGGRRGSQVSPRSQVTIRWHSITVVASEVTKSSIKDTDKAEDRSCVDRLGS